MFGFKGLKGDGSVKLAGGTPALRVIGDFTILNNTTTHSLALDATANSTGIHPCGVYSGPSKQHCRTASVVLQR